MSEMDDKTRKKAAFDQMSTEELEELIRKDSQSFENSDVDDIMLILEVIEKREKTNPSGKYTDIDTAWDSFNKNYRPANNDAESLYDFALDMKANAISLSSSNEPKTTYTYRHGRRIMKHKAALRFAFVLSLLVILLFSSTIVARAFGFDLWGVVVKWTKDTFNFSVEATTSSDEIGTPKQYQNLKQALSDYDVKVELTPTWIPDGFVLKEISVVESPKKTLFIAIYTQAEKTLTISVSRLSEGTNGIYEKDDKNFVAYEQNDIDHFIMTNLDQVLAVWFFENYECSITGNISEAEIKSMIDSIYER